MRPVQREKFETDGSRLGCSWRGLERILGGSRDRPGSPARWAGLIGRILLDDDIGLTIEPFSPSKLPTAESDIAANLTLRSLATIVKLREVVIQLWLRGGNDTVV